MKQYFLRRWVRCALVFMVILTLRVAWCRLLPHDDPEGSNLLVNVVFSAVLTAVYALIDWIIVKNCSKHR